MASIGIYLPDNNQEHRRVVTAFAMGVSAHGHRVITIQPEDKAHCDVAVVFGVYKKNVAASIGRGAVKELYEATGKPVIVLEKGFVRRDEYYMAGVGGLNNRAEFYNSDMPSDRWDALGVDLAPWSRGGYVLLCGQVPWDASVQHTDHIRWIQDTYDRLSREARLPVRIRPHPLGPDLGIDKEIAADGDLAEVLAGAAVVVTFNSNVAVDALLAGKPVFAADEGSMAWRVANRDLTYINSPKAPDREQWAYDLAYAQWNLEEMRSGEAWEHLNRGLCL